MEMKLIRHENRQIKQHNVEKLHWTVARCSGSVLERVIQLGAGSAKSSAG